MTRRFDIGTVADAVPRLDGRAVRGAPTRFYRRNILGGDVCGLWLGGRPLYDVAVYDPAGTLLGEIGPEGAHAQQKYDELRRTLVAETFHA